MTVKWPAKDPDEVLDYSIDWTERLDAADTISTVVWGSSSPAGITRTSQQLSGAVTSAFFSGGTAGETYSIVCTIMTAGGRTMQETAKLPVKER